MHHLKLHNAMADVQSLIGLMNEVGVTKDVLENHTFSIDFVRATLKYRPELNRCLIILNRIPPEVLSKSMATETAGSGLTLQHLQLAFRRGGETGVEYILKEKFNGQARVTVDKKLLKRISSYVSSLLK